MNVEGGAIVHGYPVGTMGAVLTAHILHSIRRDGLKKGYSRFALVAAKASPSPWKYGIDDKPNSYRIKEKQRGKHAKQTD